MCKGLKQSFSILRKFPALFIVRTICILSLPRKVLIVQESIFNLWFQNPIDVYFSTALLALQCVKPMSLVYCNFSSLKDHPFN